MDLAPEIKKELFEIVHRPSALRKELKLKSRKIYSVRYGIKIASFVGIRVWNSLNPLSFSSQKSKAGFLKTTLANFVNLTFNESSIKFRGGSASPVTLEM